MTGCAKMAALLNGAGYEWYYLLRPRQRSAGGAFSCAGGRYARRHVLTARRAALAEMAAAAIRTAFVQEDHEAAVSQWRQVADSLRPRFEKLAQLMHQAEPDVLAFMTFPKDHRTKIHSTNPLERLNKEVKRRTIGGGKPSQRSSIAWCFQVCHSRSDLENFTPAA